MNSHSNKKAWKTFRAYRAPGELNPSTDGQKMLALKIDESFLMAYMDDKRPEGPAQIGVAGKVFYIEPVADCLKVTRMK